MVLTYYVLKSETNLPPGTFFLDPYDHEKYTPSANESLTDFIARIKEARKTKNAPSPTDVEWRMLVNESLFVTTPEQRRGEFFIPKQTTPGIREVLAFARTVVSQIHVGDGVPISIRQKRARDFCLNSCALHQTSKNWNDKAKVAETISAMAGASGVGTYPEEKRLGTCGMCGCGLSNKVRFSAQAAFASLSPDDLDKILRVYGSQAFDKCWILKECVDSPTLLQHLRNKAAAGHAHGRDLLNAYETARARQGI